MSIPEKPAPVVLREPGRTRPRKDLSATTRQVRKQESPAMKCPIDDETLVITTREGIEIDYCPKCRGIWLDRGELDKLIERAAPAAAGRRDDDDDDDYDDDDRAYRRGHKRHGSKPRRKKRKSILEELFDF